MIEFIASEAPDLIVGFVPAIVALGMTAGQLIATGVSTAGSLYSMGKNTTKANEASRRAGKSAEQRGVLIQDARDRIGASNANRTLDVNKKQYNDNLDALIAVQEGKDYDQRNVTVGASRDQAMLQKGLNLVTDQQIKQEEAIATKVADRDIEIEQELAGLDIGEANLKSADELAFLNQEQSYRVAANTAGAQLMSDVVTPLAEFGGQKIDSGLAARSINKAGGAQAIATAGLNSFDGNRMGVIEANNPALANAMTSNPEFAKSLGSLYSGGVIPENKAITDLMESALDYETIHGIAAGFQ